MKSKAEQYGEFFKRVVPDTPKFRKAYVTREGTLYTDTMNLEPSEALQLADWIYDTFGVPEVPNGKQPGWSRED